MRGLGAADDDVVDGNKDQLYGVPNEAHDGETDGATGSDLFKLLRVGLGAPLQQSSRADCELLRFFNVFHPSFTALRNKKVKNATTNPI